MVKICTRGRGLGALSLLISGKEHLVVKQTTESSSERKFTGPGLPDMGILDIRLKPQSRSLCARSDEERQTARPYLEWMNYSSELQETIVSCQFLLIKHFYPAFGFILIQNPPQALTVALYPCDSGTLKDLQASGKKHLLPFH